jgi:hypothetical protein
MFTESHPRVRVADYYRRGGTDLVTLIAGGFMRPSKPRKFDRQHPEAARDAMEEIKDLAGDPKAVQNDIRYMNANRDRALGEADRTGRHYDEETGEETDKGSAASEDHEAD